MIPQPTDEIRLAHQQALEIPKSFDDSDPMEQLRRSLWRKVFRAAEQTAKALNRVRWSKDSDYVTPDMVQRDYEATDIVNHWYLDIETSSNITHDFRAHDRCTGFKTIGQELKELEIQENAEAYVTWERCFREWWFGGKKGPKPRQPKKIKYAIVTTEDFDTFGTGAWSEQEDEVETLQQLRERKAEFRQAPNEDPENPFEDNHQCKRLTYRHTKNGGHRSYRGSRGVLNGLYVKTESEPTYRTPQGRYRLMRTLLQSDNVLDVQLAKGMNRKFTFPAEAKAKANARKLEAKHSQHC